VRLEILVSDFHVYYTEKEIAEIVFQILCVLNFIHAKGIINSDLKPENILFLTDDPRSLKIKIANFATASVLEEMQDKVSEQVELRDWCFSSPSVMSGFAAKKQCDIWSAGCILFLLLTGKMPIVDSNIASLDNFLCK
jgi:serine/threonine protein kinase